MGALVSKDKVQRRLDEVTSAEGGQQQSPAQEEAQAAKGRKEDAEKIEKLKAALRQKMEVSLDPGPRIDSPYMASFLGGRFGEGLPTPPSSSLSQKSDGKRTVRRGRGWIARLWRKPS